MTAIVYDAPSGSSGESSTVTRTRAWLDDSPALDAVLADGAGRAEKVASDTLARAYDAVGFLPAGG